MNNLQVVVLFLHSSKLRIVQISIIDMKEQNKLSKLLIE